MLAISTTDADLDARLKRFCAPLYATGRFLQGGHTEQSLNATATFVQFEGRFYAVTCHHVIAAFFSAGIEKNLSLIPTIHTGNLIHQMGSYAQDGSYQWSFLSCREFPNAQDVCDENDAALEACARRNGARPDLAIADITSIWDQLKDTRTAEALNLDAWNADDQPSLQPVWMAFGFPDQHKSQVDGKVAAPMPRVSAQLETSMDGEPETFTLCSTLESAHGWGFSGMSGGPVFAAHPDKDVIYFMGLTFEGAPASSAPSEATSSVFLETDICLRGYLITTSRFRKWLDLAKYGVATSIYPSDL